MPNSITLRGEVYSVGDVILVVARSSLEHERLRDVFIVYATEDGAHTWGPYMAPSLKKIGHVRLPSELSGLELCDKLESLAAPFLRLQEAQ